MRALFAGVVVLSMGTGACALIAGLNDYEGHSGDDSSVANVIKDDAPVATEDANDPPLNGEAAATDDANEPVGSDADWVITDDAALSPDVNTTCDTTTCPGCCKNGQCVGGASVATCGGGGGLCTDCTSMGGACTSGSCTTKPVDAGAPKTCTASKCQLCIPVYQSSCCKSDQTCGCKTNFGGNGSCN
jgi:hypothetical protein